MKFKALSIFLLSVFLLTGAFVPDTKAGTWTWLDDSDVDTGVLKFNYFSCYPEHVWARGEKWSLSHKGNHSYTPVYAGRGCNWRYAFLGYHHGYILVQDVQVHLKHPNFKGITNYRINDVYIGAVNQDKAPGGWSVILPASPGGGGHADINLFTGSHPTKLNVHMYASYNSPNLLMGADAVSIGWFYN